MPRLVTPVGTIADGLTLLALVLMPNGGLAIGGRLGIGFGDIIFTVAVGVRGFHLLIGGLPLGRMRRWAFLYGLVGALCGAGLVSGIVNGNPLTGIYVAMVFTLLGSLLLVSTFGGDDHEQNVRRLATAFGLGCLVLAASSFFGPRGLGRAIGYAVHPNALGHTLIMGTALTVWLADRSTTLRQRAFWLGATVLSLGGMIQSGSRGGTLALLIFGGLYLCLRGDFRVALATVAAAWLLVLALLAGGFDLGRGNPIERLFSGNETSQASDAERRNLLSDNIEDIGQDPLFGKGWETITDIHVVYFQNWVGGGIVPALLIMLLGVTMVVMPLWQPRRELALACGAAGLAVAWLFTNIFTARDQWMFLAIVFGQSPSPLILRSQIRAALR